MNQDINLQINETREALLNVINKSQLPITIIAMMIKELATEAKQQETAYLMQALSKKVTPEISYEESEEDIKE